MLLTQSKLKELLHYDPKTGDFTRKVATCNSIKIGDVAGYQRPDGYIIIHLLKTRHLAHRLAWL